MAYNALLASLQVAGHVDLVSTLPTSLDLNLASKQFVGLWQHGVEAFSNAAAPRK